MTLTAKLKIWRSNPIGETFYPFVLAGLYLADYVRELRGRYESLELQVVRAPAAGPTERD